LPSALKTEKNHSSPKVATINPDSAVSDLHFFALFAVVKVGRPFVVVAVEPVSVGVTTVEVVVVSSEDAVELSELEVKAVDEHGKKIVL